CQPPAPDAVPPNIVLFIADDWSYPHAGVFGDQTVRTPAIDALAAGGTVFPNAFCASPSCSPSRASILTGRYPFQNGPAGNLWSKFPRELAVYPELLAKAGYATGHERKAWGPGDWQATGWPHNPAGPAFANMRVFLDQKPAGQPFCYWFGSRDPHRVYVPNLGALTGMQPDSVAVPDFLPDLPCVRNDMLDYYAEVERFDRDVGQVVDLLRARGELENTFIVVTSDNGMPFPRAKATLYDAGARVPLIVHWPARVPAGRVSEAYVNLASLAPTFLSVAGEEVPNGMYLPDLSDVFTGAAAGAKDVILARERHAQVRADSVSYPVRGLRNDDYLYLRNYFPDRWPAGDPEAILSVGAYGDVDNSITKMLLLDGQGGDRLRDLSFGKRPAEELYNLANDPYQLFNLAEDPAYNATLASLRENLVARLREAEDPRATDPQTIYWDTVRYTPTYGKRTYDLKAFLEEYRYATDQATNLQYRKCLE
ncbi:MAG: sulfatase, partial [Bacteroidota bacterium]